MQTNKILSAPLIDLIFDGRNKEYGAYELRVHYQKRIKTAMLATFTIAAVVIGGAVLANSLKKPQEKNVIISDGYVIANLPDDEIPEPPPKEELPHEEIPQKTEKFIDNIKIVDKAEVIDPPPDQAALLDADIGNVKMDGANADNIARPEVISKGLSAGILEQPEKKDEGPLSIVEIEAKFEGNWEKFLRTNLNPQVPVDNNAPPGNHTILIQFVVDIDGNISDIKPLSHIGFGMEQEAVRVLQKATKWKPAIQNGYAVKAYRRQPITFQVLED